ncbi:MAG: hypothetical protein ACXWL5_01695 [Candidatus Chromulinivorax sp.]
MRKLLSIICLFLSTTIYAINEYTNQTFMFPKEIFGSFGMEQASWHNIMYNKNSRGVALQAYAYAQTSLFNSTAPQYFSFDFLDQIIVQNDPTNTTYDEQTFTRNILGAWLGIDGTTPYTASYSLTPKQSQEGVTVAFSQDLSKFFEFAFLRNSSFTFSVPIVRVKNQLQFAGDQTTLQALQGANWSSMGLSQPWEYIMLNDQVQEGTKFTNIKIQYSSKYESLDDVQIATSTFIVLPFVPAITNEYLFQPLFGYNGHIVWAAGIVFQIPLLRSQDQKSRICFYTGMENKLLLSNNQDRTLEIAGKPYSRYMPLYDRYTNTLVPGVNVFTRNCTVNPYNFINFIAGFRYKYVDSVVEAGYELWGHDTETITINSTNPWVDDRYGIANINGLGEFDPNPPAVQTASGSTINYVVPDTVNTYIKAKDLNFLPAEARATLVHRAYVTLGYGNKTDQTDFFLNLGLFMEIVQNNAAFSNWGGFFKTGATF